MPCLPAGLTTRRTTTSDSGCGLWRRGVRPMFLHPILLRHQPAVDSPVALRVGLSGTWFPLGRLSLVFSCRSTKNGFSLSKRLLKGQSNFPRHPSMMNGLENELCLKIQSRLLCHQGLDVATNAPQEWDARNGSVAGRLKPAPGETLLCWELGCSYALLLLRA